MSVADIIIIKYLNWIYKIINQNTIWRYIPNQFSIVNCNFNWKIEICEMRYKFINFNDIYIMYYRYKMIPLNIFKIINNT